MGVLTELLYKTKTNEEPDQSVLFENVDFFLNWPIILSVTLLSVFKLDCKLLALARLHKSVVYTWYML